MLGKLAVRNVKRQAISYIIYFITVVLAVALMFAINNILYSKELEKVLPGMDYIDNILEASIIFVALVVGFIIAYATAFLLRKRKKEFGTYMLLGIKRFAILRLFVTENLIVGAVSFVAGSLLGLGVFQVLNAVVCSIMGNNFDPLKLAPGSFWLTLWIWAAVFLVAILYSAITLMRSKISDLLKVKDARFKPLKDKARNNITYILLGSIIALIVFEVWIFLDVLGNANTGSEAYLLKSETAYIVIPALGIFAIALLAVYVPKKPIVEKILAIAMLGLFFAACLFEIWVFSEHMGFWKRPNSILEGYYVYHALYPAGIALMFSAIFLFHIFSRSFYLSRLEGKKKLHGSNSFHFRQMASSLNRNAAIMGTIALLLSISFFFSNFAFSMRYLQIEEINNDMPFDVIGTWAVDPMPEEGEHTSTPGDVISEAQKYSPITFCHEYGIYAGEDINGVEHASTIVLKQNGLNPLLKNTNQPELNNLAADEFYLIVTVLEADIENQFISNPYEWFKEGDTISVFGKELKYRGVKYVKIQTQQMTLYSRYFITVADVVLSDSEWEEHLARTVLVMNTKDYLPQDFYYAFTSKAYVDSKYLKIDDVNARSAVIMASVLYLGVAFMFIAMALLSLKIMSEADLDKRRYSILNMLGVNERWQRKILFRQIFTFFAAPMLMPFLIAIPSVVFSALFSMYIIGSIPISIYTIGAAVPLIYAGIYACYFAATYYLSVKNNIKPLENPKIRLLRGNK